MVGGTPPRRNRALPPPAPDEAAPQCISGRTSYLRVRLAFHPYPQLIRALCNGHRFGPPPPLTAASPWPWVAHPVSGLPRATRRPVQTRCRCGSGYQRLSLAARDLSPVRSTKSTPSPDQAGSDGPRARGFRHSFTPRSRGAFHLSLAVLYAIGPAGCLALDRGRPCFPPDCTCPAVLTHHPRVGCRFAYGALTRSGRPFQWRSATAPIGNSVAAPAGPPGQPSYPGRA